jgi:hypothetical protein
MKVLKSKAKEEKEEEEEEVYFAFDNEEQQKKKKKRGSYLGVLSHSEKAAIFCLTNCLQYKA